MTYNFNNLVWNNLDLIFPEGGTVLEDVWYTNRQLRNMNLPFIVSREETHARDMVKSYEEIVWKNDGSMERIPFYNIYIEFIVCKFYCFGIYYIYHFAKYRSFKCRYTGIYYRIS